MTEEERIYYLKRTIRSIEEMNSRLDAVNKRNRQANKVLLVATIIGCIALLITILR